MPIKVRCKECSTVMAVPDKAAGRAVKCKSCGGRVPVPNPAARKAKASRSAQGAAGGEAAKSRPVKKRPVKKRRPRPAPEPSFDDFGDSDDLFGGLDLGRAEHADQRVCPGCASPVDEDDIECPKCGVNIETGALSEKQRVRIARKGPPPEEFYSKALPNAWKFLMNHKSWAVKTGLNWGISVAMVILAAFVLNWYIDGRIRELVDTAEGPVEITDSYVLIKPTENGDILYDGVKYGTGSTRLDANKQLILPPPRIAAMTSPPAIFWSFIFVIFTLGCGGWAWTLADKIVHLTMSGEKKIKRFAGDMFGNMTKGFTTIFWPIVLMYPVIWIPVAMHFSGVGDVACIATFATLMLIPYMVFLAPAMVHMSQPYTYRAWLINWMAKDWVNTLVPSMYVSVLFFFLVLMIPLGIAIGIAVGWNQFSDFYTNQIELPALNAMFGYTAEDADSSWMFAFTRMPLLFTVAALTCTTLGMLLAFPSILMMRVFGLFGLYFKPDLSLCAEQTPLAPAGFGPRFLAIQVDLIISAGIGLACYLGSGYAAGLVGHLYNSPQIAAIARWVIFGLALTGILGFYFSRWESGAGRATLGKWTFGMIVLREDNEPMDTNLALKRAAASLISVLSLGMTFLMCAFHPEHRAVHDTLTKTKVVWRGDENL